MQELCFQDLEPEPQKYFIFIRFSERNSPDFLEKEAEKLRKLALAQNLQISEKVIFYKSRARGKDYGIDKISRILNQEKCEAVFCRDLKVLARNFSEIKKISELLKSRKLKEIRTPEKSIRVALPSFDEIIQRI